MLFLCDKLKIEVNMFNSNVDIKTYACMSVAIMLIGALTFGVVCRISKWVSAENGAMGDVFGKTVAVVVDDFESDDLKKGNLVVVETMSIATLNQGDYVVYNDLHSKSLRNDNCGQILSIVDDYIYIKSDKEEEITPISAGLCLGKLQFREQVDCGWFRFVSSSWCDVVFILCTLSALVGLGYYLVMRSKGHSLPTENQILEDG